MLRTLTMASSLLAAASFVAVAFGGDLKSGLQEGEATTPFQVRNITGQKCEGIVKAEVNSLCYR